MRKQVAHWGMCLSSPAWNVCSAGNCDRKNPEESQRRGIINILSPELCPELPKQKSHKRLFKGKGGDIMEFDKEENEILEAYGSGKIKLSKPSAKEIEATKAAAESTFKKDKRVTIRLYNHDYKGIQKKALQMGVPYQTLISGIIHRYIEGDLTSKNS
jgi:predicted DNA binding CopG/RHH family protein